LALVTIASRDLDWMYSPPLNIPSMNARDIIARQDPSVTWTRSSLDIHSISKNTVYFNMHGSKVVWLMR